MPPVTLDLASLRARLAGARGADLWRSLDEVAGTPAFRQFLGAEFPAAARLAGGPDRRRFLRLMAASFALGGLTGCDDPDGRDYEVPYVRNPLRRQPGIAVHYATASLIDGLADGAVVRTIDGRPIKIEGNAEHPWSRGGSNVLMQASVLGLYDPFRSQTVRNLNRTSSWQAFRGFAAGHFAEIGSDDGRGLRVLTGPITSPSLAAQLATMQRTFPAMRWHSHAGIGRDAVYAGAAAAFGRPVETRWDFSSAQTVVSLAGDFLDLGPQQVGASRAWSDARSNGRLLTMFSAAAMPNLTSAKADDATVASPADLASLADRLKAALGGERAGEGPLGAWVSRVAKALVEARGRSIVLTGAAQPADEHAAVHRLNDALGNVGATVGYTDPVVVAASSLADLVRDMQAGEVTTLAILDSNPVYSAAGDLGFADALKRVKTKIHAGLYVDETAAYADWHLPLAHPLEAWGDARSLDGTATLVQPAIAPLYDGRSVAEIVSMLADAQPADGRDLLRVHWSSLEPAAFDEALRAGFVAGSALPAVAVSARGAAAPTPAAAGLTVLFRPDPTVWDGSVADNAWLQETPKPLTKVVWENVVGVSPALAEREKLSAGDIVRLEADGRSLEGPAWITPGQADDAVTVHLGYGRTAAELLSQGLGYDAYALRSDASPHQLAGATLVRVGRGQKVATTQDHGSMEGHGFVRVLAEGAAFPVEEPLATFYSRKEDGGRAWGMVIDLDACTGCNACVVACQAENNIPVVGRDEVALGREMHWLRIDRYHDGPLDAPRTHFQPVPCMHCEDAPCEVGCPVEATLHDHEGLNLMVYNRCVGTRACSGYCPYKVRHFNWYDYAGDAAPVAQLQRNPSVTVRAGGVMEKCTYCVQRIAAARIDADKGDGLIPDGRVTTACQGACPTRAITFGDLNDPSAQVRAARADPRNYALLGELGVRPRTTYLAKRAPAEGDHA
jgi:molybdopterin-containing oxidoreductase family iron-sulfur binding subunit